ncbi:MAG TPA: ABC transporter substrate-binding protein [Acidimicrobiia bacterium]|nr:ABC transporter substrate-binding protein [Acidimicrobiia bacterium]
MRRIALFSALLVALAACGTTGETTRSTAAATTMVADETVDTESPDFPVMVDAANGEVIVELRPERIVSLAPTATEILFAIGAGDQVIAVDEFSNFPEEAPTTDLSGFEPNVEAVAALDPDLVVVSDDLNDIVSALTSIEIPVIHHPAAATLDDSYTQIEQLGLATGNLDDAATLVASIQDDIDRLVASLPEIDEPLSYYHELDSSLFSVTAETFIGEIYSLVGLENIADEVETQYPQLSAEYIIDADPDLIFLADTKCCGESPETVAARPGWEQLTAVSRGSVVALDDDVASRWGPRVVELLETIVGAVLSMEAVGS